MIEATVKIEFITPAFVGNDEPNNVALNEKALKGLLRFWWRAFLSDPSLVETKLFEEEEKIFGSQNRSSGFSILITERREENREEFVNFLRDQEREDEKLDGVKYLFYTKVRGANRFIEPGSTYTINFFAKDEDTMSKVLKSLWFLENFGGIGSRSRRGAGSFIVSSIKIPEGGSDNLKSVKEKFLYNYNESERVTKLINEGVNTFANSSRSSYNGFPKFTSFSSHSKIGICCVDNRWVSWLDAVNNIGGIFKDYRDYSTSKKFGPQAALLHKYFLGEKKGDRFIVDRNEFAKGKEELRKNPPEKVYFGLPIMYSFKDENGKAAKEKRGDKEVNITARAEPARFNGEILGRRASPLFFRFGRFPVDNGKYYVVVSTFPGKFLPVDIYLGGGNAPTPIFFNPNDNKMKAVLNEFLNDLGGIQWIK
jgi:CRISPR type III-B/RAMP module RAMP protein Cmr1